MTSGPSGGGLPANAYGNRWVPYLFEAAVRLVWLPGGIGRLREQTLDALDLEPGMRVLELGCGTGGVTQRLLRRGAVVTAVDRSKYMLQHARRRAPGATFIETDVLDLETGGRYDRVLLAFMIHELDSGSRVKVLSLSRELLDANGLVGILEWDAPPLGLVRTAWIGFVRLLEPPSALEIAHGVLNDELRRAELVPLKKVSLAAGRAQVLVARAAERP